MNQPPDKPLVGGGSGFYVRPHSRTAKYKYENKMHCFIGD
jgi:hypothetical protein